MTDVQGTCLLRSRLAIMLGAFALLAAAPVIVSASESLAPLTGDRVMITEFNGKPPFKRRIVSADTLPATELARFEPQSERAAGEGRRVERVRVVDWRGKPPFKRSIVEVDTADVTELARFEPAGDVRVAPARPRFPGKRFPLRPAR